MRASSSESLREQRIRDMHRLLQHRRSGALYSIEQLTEWGTLERGFDRYPSMLVDIVAPLSQTIHMDFVIEKNEAEVERGETSDPGKTMINPRKLVCDPCGLTFGSQEECSVHRCKQPHLSSQTKFSDGLELSDTGRFVDELVCPVDVQDKNEVLEIFRCKSCEKEFAFKENFLAHTQLHTHLSQPDSQGSFQLRCPFASCSGVFDLWESLCTHLTSVHRHNPSDLLRCDECLQWFLSPFLLLTHQCTITNESRLFRDIFLSQ